MTLKKFLKKALKEDLTILEIENYCEEISDNYKTEKVKSLETGIKSFIDLQRMLHEIMAQKALDAYNIMNESKSDLEPLNDSDFEFNHWIEKGFFNQCVEHGYENINDLLKDDFLSIDDNFRHQFDALYEILEFLETKKSDKKFDSESNKTQNNSNQIFHLLSLTSILDLLEDLELWPDVKLDIVEILDEVRNRYSESLIEANKSELTKNLYWSEKPNIFYMRELDRVLNLTNASIQRIDLEFKKYSDFIIEKYTREYTLQKYFHMSVSNFNSFYLYAKDRIKEIKELQGKQQSIEIVSNQTETKKDLFIIAELLATNKIQVVKNKFIFKGEKYENGYNLNTGLNEFYKYHPKKNFTQYLNDFKSKSGQKYLLETFDSEKNKLDDKNIKRLRKLKKYFDKEKIIILNKDFKEAFKRSN